MIFGYIVLNSWGIGYRNRPEFLQKLIKEEYFLPKSQLNTISVKRLVQLDHSKPSVSVTEVCERALQFCTLREISFGHSVCERRKFFALHYSSFFCLFGSLLTKRTSFSLISNFINLHPSFHGAAVVGWVNIMGF